MSENDISLTGLFSPDKRRAFIRIFKAVYLSLTYGILFYHLLKFFVLLTMKVCNIIHTNIYDSFVWYKSCFFNFLQYTFYI